MSVLLRKLSSRCQVHLVQLQVFPPPPPATVSDDLRLHSFYRGTAQRLREVRRRVEAAKLDVEDIIRHAKVSKLLFLKKPYSQNTDSVLCCAKVFCV